MYAQTFQMWSNDSKAATLLYEQLATWYQLPPLAQLLQAAQEDLDQWQCDQAVQVYYLDNLRERNTRALFQVRFKTSPMAREYTDLFLSVLPQSQQVHTMTFHFPAKGDRGCSARLIAFLKSLDKQGMLIPDFEIAGYAERKDMRFIREHSLPAFVWQERIERYLHVVERVEEVREMQKELRSYKDR